MEVIPVNKIKNLVFAAFQIVAPSFKSSNNNQEFLVMTLIPSLSEDHFLRKNGY